MIELSLFNAFMALMTGAHEDTEISCTFCKNEIRAVNAGGQLVFEMEKLDGEDVVRVLYREYDALYDESSPYVEIGYKLRGNEMFHAYKKRVKLDVKKKITTETGTINAGSNSGWSWLSVSMDMPLKDDLFVTWRESVCTQGGSDKADPLGHKWIEITEVEAGHTKMGRNFSDGRKLGSKNKWNDLAMIKRKIAERLKLLGPEGELLWTFLPEQYRK